MADLLESVALITDPTLFVPARLLRIAHEMVPASRASAPVGSPGQALLSWRGVHQAHASTCSHCKTARLFSVHDRLQRCSLFRSLWQLAVEGVRPWSFATLRTGKAQLSAKAAWKAYPAKTPEDYAFSAEVQANYVRDGVAALVSVRERKRRLRMKSATSSGFVVTKWTAVDSPAAKQSRTEWAAAHPQQVQRFYAREPGAEAHLPTAAYKSKRRLVYDFKDINQRTVDCPIVYDSLVDAASAAESSDFLAAVDLKDGFTAIPVHLAEGIWSAAAHSVDAG